jgi:hypothetical protein
MRNGRNGVSRWQGLGDDFDGMYGDDGNDDVEYVGVIEEESVSGMGSNGVRPVPSTVSRMRMRPRSPVPTATPQPMPPDQPSPVVVPTASGEVRLNPDAVRMVQKSPTMEMGGKAVKRAEPGVYLVMQPSRWNQLGQAPVEAAYAGLGTNNSGGFNVGGLISGILETGSEITGSVLQYQQSQAELRARREAERAAREAELEAARSERASASEQAQREFELQMERIRTLREAGREEEARAVEEQLPVAASTGTSPVVWVLGALVLAGGVGAVVYFVTKKDKDKD